MNYLSLFSGIGGFEIGIGPKGRCVGYSEIDPYANAIYSRHFPHHKNYGDITKIVPEKLPAFDLLVGGFPCQAFSVAGKRRGFDDRRGTLFFEIARIVEHCKPKLLLLENVKGLLSHGEGKTFAKIVATLDDLGYDVQWQVLDSKDFGLPQTRQRVFIAGNLRGTYRPEVFPIRQARAANHTQGEVLVRIHDGSKRGYAEAEYGDGIDASFPNSANRRGRVTRGIAHTLTTKAELFTVFAPDKIRRLTPLECERIQGFPDGWTSMGTEGGVTDTQRYKCLGNAVCPPVIDAIAKKLLR